MTSDEKQKLFKFSKVCKISDNQIFKLSTPNNFQSTKDDLYASLRLFLLLGKFIGLLHIQGMFQSDFTNLKFRKLSCATMVTMLAILLISLNVAISFLGIVLCPISNVQEMLTIQVFLFFTGAAFTFIYFYRHSLELVEIFRDWKIMDVHFMKSDKRLFRDVNLVTAIVMTSAILENSVWHAAIFRWEDQETNTNMTKLENTGFWPTQYCRSRNIRSGFIHWNLMTNSLTFIGNKLALYSWNYVDLLIVVLARAMYFKFKTLSLLAKSVFLRHEAEQDVSSWRQLAKDHQTLRNMLEKINGFLSPLIFLSYGMNIYWICIHINYGFGYLDTHGDDLIILYKYWSVGHVIARAILVNIMAANVNSWAHDVNSTFSKCPEELYDSQVQRSERFNSANTIGFSGLNCFTVTKPLLLQIVGVIFTVEVVLIQASQSSVKSFT